VLSTSTSIISSPKSYLHKINFQLTTTPLSDHLVFYPQFFLFLLGVEDSHSCWKICNWLFVVCGYYTGIDSSWRGFCWRRG